MNLSFSINIAGIDGAGVFTSPNDNKEYVCIPTEGTFKGRNGGYYVNFIAYESTDPKYGTHSIKQSKIKNGKFLGNIHEMPAKPESSEDMPEFNNPFLKHQER
jgi:hypothetical protein